MIELICGLIVLVIGLYILVYGSVFFVAGVAYGYWGLSIGMAPILWLLMIVGTIVGFVVALKNAFKAIKAMKVKE